MSSKCKTSAPPAYYILKATQGRLWNKRTFFAIAKSTGGFRFGVEKSNARRFHSEAEAQAALDEIRMVQSPSAVKALKIKVIKERIWTRWF